MTVYSWDDVTQMRVPWREFAPQGTALTVGSFDGPHRGHTAIFDQILARRRPPPSDPAQSSLIPGVVTFARPPAALYEGALFPGMVCTLENRLKFFQQKGFVFTILIDFSEKFATIDGGVFLSALVQNCGMRFLAESTDFRLGYRGAFDVPAIRDASLRLGFQFMVVPPVMHGSGRISSSRMRQAILAGDFELAGAMLGRPSEHRLL
ncbi:MAG: FAD synthetase family protein [Spirochaetaceae bacterium]|jgi:FAD synthase|nr:FAD synthetase family protein [Spirochaetaceae bacterium]